MVPQGLMSPMMPLPLDVAGMPVAPMDAPRPQPIPITALASALASATPENQRVVFYSLIIFMYWMFPIAHQLHPFFRQIILELLNWNTMHAYTFSQLEMGY